jgi:hypothetical protein
MFEKITDKTLYHFTANKQYKRALTAGQKVIAGVDYNPFFAFYEGARLYPVTLEDKSIVQVRAIKFLTKVKEGVINCPRLPVIAHEVAQHYIMLARELIMEEIRIRDFSEAPSRQRCLYLADSLEEARTWQKRIGDGGEICSLTCNGVTHRADAHLLLGDSEPLSETRARAARYWRGEASETPEWETLFVGEAIVTAIGL